jgi:hypothetical protein
MDELNTQSKAIELKIHEKESDNRINNTWKSCCGLTLDKRSTIFFSTYSMSLILVFFCIYKLAGEISCSETNVYISLLTLIIGVYIKNPDL